MDKDLDAFLLKFNKTKKDLAKAGYNWSDLMKIADDYEDYRKELLPVIEAIAKKFHRIHAVHSIRYRVKETDHLIEKLIRRRIVKPKSKRLTVANYKDHIHDFAGMRILHIYKEQWREINDFIFESFEINDVDEPMAYIARDDDTDQYKRAGLAVTPGRDIGYRSIHYLVSVPLKKGGRKKCDIEIQVRTIFEEGWCEIDHDIRYPYELDNELLSRSMSAFNILARTADEMGSFVHYLREDAAFNKQRRVELDAVKKIDQEHQRLIKKLERRIAVIEKTDPKAAESLMADLTDLTENQEDKAHLLFAPVLPQLFSLRSKRGKKKTQSFTNDVSRKKKNN